MIPIIKKKLSCTEEKNTYNKNRDAIEESIPIVTLFFITNESVKYSLFAFICVLRTTLGKKTSKNPNTSVNAPIPKRSIDNSFNFEPYS